ncbi:MAG: flagellar hook-basal body complex protein FliE [Acetobacteraceae bacterium]|nr:flagellar hook-basal body complex protein FliE [Acetobacteraceae bacterium]
MIPIITAVAGVLSALSSIVTLENAPKAGSSDSAQPNATDAPAPAFSDALKSALDRVDSAISTANDKAKAFASGDQGVSLSDVMISLEQANLAFQAAAAVRDKVTAAYTNIMNMPV